MIFTIHRENRLLLENTYKAIQSLEGKGLISITGRKGNILNARSRKGSWLYFSYKHVHFLTQRSALLGSEHVHSGAHNKTNYTKLNILNDEILESTPNSIKSIGEVIAKMPTSQQ